MISIVCSSQNPDENFRKHVLETCGLINVEFIFYENKNQYSLTELYNKGLRESKYDIVVYLHCDVVINSRNWGQKLIKHYKRNPEYGILGVAGSSFMPESGIWWEKRRFMKGAVEHEHEGRKWLSKYSDDIGNQIDEVVILDGVFFSVHKKRIKRGFDEDIKGFHFYDVSFCFRNFKEGIKLGVHHDIKITHKSIGITTEEWSQNKEIFLKKYGNDLPRKAEVNFKNKKIKVLIGCLNFNNYTGSELYVYELAKELSKKNFDITICSNIGGDIVKRIKSFGVKCISIKEPPFYKLGDGKWGVNVNGQIVPSKEGVLHKIGEPDFDILHLNHRPVTEFMLKLYPDIPVISSIHSEIIDLEYPVKHPNIVKYIAIRPEIKNFMVENFKISEDKIDVVYNPVDCDRFKPSKHIENRKNKRILSISSIDYLRKNMLSDLIETTRNNGDELWIVGKKNSDDYLADMMKGQEHVKYFPPTFKTEELIRQVDETSGVLLGRVTIESWMCGKPAWIYDIDNTGNINSKVLTYPPEDISKFKSNIVAKTIIEKYKEIIE